MAIFAKLFRIDPEHQLLVRVKDGDEGPEMIISTNVEGITMSMTVGAFRDDEEGWELCDKKLKDFRHDLAQSTFRGMRGAIEGVA